MSISVTPKSNGFHPLETDLPTKKRIPQRGSIDLGLAISALHCTFGTPVTCAQIASFCTWNPTKNRDETVSRQAVERIEKIALRKCRAYLYRHKELQDELAEIFNR